MEVTYRREMKHNYLITEPEEAGYDSYEMHMLAANGIEGLLKFHIKQVDSRRFYYYEITSKQPLSRILEYHSMGGEELRKLIGGIAQTLGRLEAYLLQERQIILEPEYIYIEPERFSVFLCLVPGRRGRFPEEMTGLLRYLLGKVNHQDKECVVMAYGLYQESLKENYGMNDLLEILGKASKSKEMEEEDEDMPYEDVSRMGTENKGERSGETGSRKTGSRGAESREAGAKGLENAGNREDDEAGFYDRESGKIQEPVSQTVRGAAVSVLAMVGTGAILWLVFGLEGIWKFWYAVAIAGILAIMAVFMGAGKKASALSGEIDQREERRLRQEEIHDWQMVFDEETEKKETEEEKEVFQTVLLTEPAPEKEVRYLRGAGQGVEDIAIAYVPYLIGKQEGLVDWVLNGDTISRIHARIDREGDEYRISDLNSTNGTSVNGRLLETNETAVLKRGDEVLIAEFAFIFT